MEDAKLWIAATLGASIGAAMLVVGAKLHRRSRLASQPALLWFAAFWVGVGTYAIAEAGWVFAWLAGVRALPLGLFVLHLKIASTCAGFAGLVLYVLALRGVGKRASSVAAGGYLVILALVETHYSWREPINVAAGEWGLRLGYARASAEPWWTIMLLLMLAPPILAAASYATLLPHAREPEQRMRILLTSGSLLLFFVPTLLAWKAGGWAWWGLTEKLLGLLMAVGVVLAMWPPRRLQTFARAPRMRDTGLEERARLLI